MLRISTLSLPQSNYVFLFFVCLSISACIPNHDAVDLKKQLALDYAYSQYPIDDINEVIFSNQLQNHYFFTDKNDDFKERVCTVSECTSWSADDICKGGQILRGVKVDSGVYKIACMPASITIAFDEAPDQNGHIEYCPVVGDKYSMIYSDVSVDDNGLLVFSNQCIFKGNS